MWRLLKLIGWTLKAIVWLALACAVAALVGLYVLERGIPRPLVQRAEAACSSGSLACRIERATFSLKGGLRLQRVSFAPSGGAGAELAGADEVTLDLSLKPRLAPSERLRGVTLRNLRFPALPPPSGTARPAAVLSLPRIGPLPLRVEGADILGVRAARVTATVAADGPRVSANPVRVEWPDSAFAMAVEGEASADFAARLVRGAVKGQAFPENILPLLQALRASGAVRQIECFSKIERPVEAEARFDVNMDNSDFVLHLGLDVGPCAYRGVPMKFARGPLAAYGTNIYTTVDVGPLQAESASGPLSGRLVYREENESLAFDAASSMDLTQLVTILNVLNRGELRPLRCDTPPRLRASGLLALDAHASPVTNALTGSLAFDEGALFKLGLKGVTAKLNLSGYSARLEDIAATSLSGGQVEGHAVFTFPYYSATATLFTARARLAGVDLTDLTPVFSLTNARAGTVSGSLLLHGRACEHTVPTLCGEGRVAVRNGLLHRMPLFAGFTDYLAATIPGVSSLVNQSSGSMDFAVSNGVLRTENLLVEGDLFSLNGRGTCDLQSESLDFVARANIFKEKTFAGRLTRLVTAPFTRLLLEFKVFGTLSRPDWSYVNIIEKITDGLSGLAEPFKGAPPPAPAPAPTP